MRFFMAAPKYTYFWKNMWVSVIYKSWLIKPRNNPVKERSKIFFWVLLFICIAVAPSSHNQDPIVFGAAQTQ